MGNIRQGDVWFEPHPSLVAGPSVMKSGPVDLLLS